MGAVAPKEKKKALDASIINVYGIKRPNYLSFL